MSTKSTFTVNVKGGTGVVVERMLPDSLDDAQWSDLVAGDVKTAVHELALQQWIIKCQGASRAALPQGKAAVQAKASAYKYGARGGPSKPVMDAAVLFAALDLKKPANVTLARAQIDALTSAGVQIVNIPAELVA